MLWEPLAPKRCTLAVIERAAGERTPPDYSAVRERGAPDERRDLIPFPELPDADDDPDGFDRQRRHDVVLRLVAVRAQKSRDGLVATLTPLELAEHDLARMVELTRQYKAGESSFPNTPSNTRAVSELIDELRARVVDLSGPPSPSID